MGTDWTPERDATLVEWLARTVKLYQQRERMEEEAELLRLRAVLAEPSAEEQIRLGRIVARFYQGPPPVGDGSWMLAVARAILADLRKQANVPSTAGGGSPLLGGEGPQPYEPAASITRADVEAALARADRRRVNDAIVDLIEADGSDTEQAAEDRRTIELVCAVLGVADAG